MWGALLELKQAYLWAGIFGSDMEHATGGRERGAPSRPEPNEVTRGRNGAVRGQDPLRRSASI